MTQVKMFYSHLAQHVSGIIMPETCWAKSE